MKNRIIPLFFAMLLLFLLPSCNETTDTDAVRSGVYAPSLTYALPDGWCFDSIPTLAYDASSDTITVDVHRDLAPLEDGFVPSEYTTATLQPDGTLLGIAGFPAYSASVAMPQSAFPSQLSGGLIQKTYALNGDTAVLETLYTPHAVDLRISLYDQNSSLLCSVSPADAFDYDLTRDIGAMEHGGEHFAVLDVTRLCRNDGVALLCVLTTEGMAAYTLEGQLAWTLTKGTPTAMVVITQTASTMYGGGEGSHDPDALLDTLLLLCEERGKQTLSVIDTVTGAYGDTVTLPATLTEQTYSVRMLAGVGYDLYVRNNRGLYGLTLKTVDGVMTADTTLLCDWAKSDIAPSDITALSVIDTDHLLLALHDADADFSTLSHYVYIKPEDVVQKEEIVLAKLCDVYNLQFAVRDFNRTSDTHRIVIRDYTDIADPETRKLRLDTDIAAGDIPDLYLFPGGQEGIFSNEAMLSSYENTGVFCDLTALLQEDASFAYDELLSVVTTPFQNDAGIQYRFPLSYSIRAYVGHASDFPDIPTVEEICAVLDDLPEGVTADRNYYALHRYLIDAALAASYDEARAVCTFDDGRMEALLTALAAWENAPMFPEDGAPLTELFKAGKLCLYRAALNTPIALKKLPMELGDGAVIIGTPNDDGTLCAELDVYAYLTVSAVSEYKIQAANFLSVYLSVNTNARADNKYFTQADIDAYFDKYADQTFIENGERSGVVHDRYASDYPGIHYKLSEDDCAAYEDFLASVTRRAYVNPAISDIFWEEYSAPGNKSIRDMLDVVQSRCEIYLSERN